MSAFSGQRLEYYQIANPNGNIKGVIENIKRWLDKDDTSIIAGVECRGGHWTCIASYTSKTLLLRDSDHRKTLHLNRLTSGEVGKDKIYRINPEEVVGIVII